VIAVHFAFSLNMVFSFTELSFVRYSSSIPLIDFVAAECLMDLFAVVPFITDLTLSAVIQLVAAVGHSLKHNEALNQSN
jgi:hypothetical protein